MKRGPLAPLIWALTELSKASATAPMNIMTQWVGESLALGWLVISLFDKLLEL